MVAVTRRGTRELAPRRRLGVAENFLPLSFLCVVFVLLLLIVMGDGITISRKSKMERSNEYRIKRVVLRNYDRTTRPVKNDRTPVEVSVAISLYHILDTNEKEQTFTCLLAIRQRWRDEYLTWNATAYDGVDTIRVPANTIWTPDLVIANFAGDKFNDYMVTNTIVFSDGLILWLFPALIKTYCTLNVKYFPFDTQECNVTFISWTHSGDQLDVIYNSTFVNTIYYNSENQEWAVDNITADRHVKYYACCKEPYPDVTFTIHMKRGSLFYIINLIAPCFLIFLISFLGFFLPVESGEKVNLETTILLALVVFLLMVGETMPPTPDCIPILGMFFASTMVMVTVALVMAVIVTNIYAKKDTPQRCPDWSIRLASRFYPAHFLPARPRSRLSPVKFGYPSAGSAGGGGGSRRHVSETLAITDTDLDSAGCICCCLCHGNHRRDPEAGGGGGGGGGAGLQLATIDALRESFDFERSEAEWRMVAKFTDRVFFWLFVAMSTCTHTTLFLQMVPETRGTVN